MPTDRQSVIAVVEGVEHERPARGVVVGNLQVTRTDRSAGAMALAAEAREEVVARRLRKFRRKSRRPNEVANV